MFFEGGEIYHKIPKNKKSNEKYQRFGAPDVNFALTYLLLH